MSSPSAGAPRAHRSSRSPTRRCARKLTPDYRLGCKRMLAPTTTIPALARRQRRRRHRRRSPRSRPHGIVDADGVEHPVDTIIFGTGFQVTDLPIADRIRGRGGRTLAERWAGQPEGLPRDRRSPASPTCSCCSGPNTGLGHNSVLLMIEAQIAYLRRALALPPRAWLATLEPTPAEAQAAFVAAVDDGTEGSVWTAGGCISWYLGPDRAQLDALAGQRPRLPARRARRLRARRDYDASSRARLRSPSAAPVGRERMMASRRSSSTAAPPSCPARRRGSAARWPCGWPPTAARSRSSTRTRTA